MITIDLRWLKHSGMGTYLRNVVPGIVASFPSYRFTLLGNTEEIDKLELPRNGKVDCIKAASRMYSIAEQLEIARKIPRGTKLFFATHYNIPLLYRGKMLVTVYDLFHVAMPSLVGGFHKTLYARFMFKAVRLKADAIITISNFTKDEFVLLTGSARQPIYPIHLGVDKDWFNIPNDESPYNRPYILYVGNIKPHKNLGALVKAFGLISDRIPHDLVLVGKKEGFITGDNAVAAEAQELKGRVHFTGYVDDNLLRRYFSHASVFVFPSLYEGFGLPPLEAMAAGCPVLVSSAASLPEVCGNAALYCNPYSIDDIVDKITELLTNSSLKDDLRIKGTVHAQKFSWDRCCDQTVDVISQLLNA